LLKSSGTLCSRWSIADTNQGSFENWIKMVLDAVLGEPVSSSISLVTGRITGIFRNFPSVFGALVQICR
jgi:hypothetical protein